MKAFGTLVLVLCSVWTFVVPKSSMREEDFRAGVLRAECIANCLNKNRTECLKSCHLFLRQEEADDFLDVISNPELVCSDVPYCHHDDANCQMGVASIYLKWDVLKSVSWTPTSFVVSVRQEELTDKNFTEWRLLQVENSTFVKLSDLACNATFQFKVTPVSGAGVMGRSRETAWITTPSCTRYLRPPAKLRVIRQDVFDQKPSATIAWDWDEPGDAACYYMIFWMSKESSDDDVKTPPEFQYQIKNLEFSTDYTVLVYSYDERFMKGSKEAAKTSLVTPPCLPTMNYNYTVCAPESPINIHTTVLTPNSSYPSVANANLSVTWDPPQHITTPGEIVKYIIEWRKEPPTHAGHLLSPDHGLVQLNSTETGMPATSVILHNLHNHNKYSIKLTAVSLGGKSDVATAIATLGLPIQVEKRETPHTVLQSIEDPGNTHKLMSAVAIAIPSGLILVLFLIISIVIYRRRTRKLSHASRMRNLPVEELNPIYDGIASLNTIYDGKVESVDSYEVEYQSLDFVGLLGEGAFGRVVKAEYYRCDGDRKRGNGKVVAVKMMKDIYTSDELRHFRLEIDAMKSLGTHPHLVSIIGCCSGPIYCLLMDYCALGDLKNYLRKYREKMGRNARSSRCIRTSLPSNMCDVVSFASYGEEIQTDDNLEVYRLATSIVDMDDIFESQLLSYARQITMGMGYLEQRKFVHRDLAARNVLLYDRRHVKISDFGLTRDVYETNMYQPTSARKLPYKWMALESLFCQKFTSKSDIWSFGIVMWELVTLGGSPYPSIPLKDLYGLLKDGYRMEKPENCSTDIYQIMLSCWHPSPNCRPSFLTLQQKLEDLLEEAQSYIDLSVAVSCDYFHNDSGSGYSITMNLVEKAKRAYLYGFQEMAQLSREQGEDQKSIQSSTIPSSIMVDISFRVRVPNQCHILQFILSSSYSSTNDSEVEATGESTKSDEHIHHGNVTISEDLTEITYIRDESAFEDYQLHSIKSSEQSDDEVFLENDKSRMNLDNNLRDEELDFENLISHNKNSDCLLRDNYDSVKSKKPFYETCFSLKQKPSFQASLKSLLDKVGKNKIIFSPVWRKRSVSLTDMDKDGRYTINL